MLTLMHFAIIIFSTRNNFSFPTSTSILFLSRRIASAEFKILSKFSKPCCVEILAMTQILVTPSTQISICVFVVCQTHITNRSCTSTVQFNSYPFASSDFSSRTTSFRYVYDSL